MRRLEMERQRRQRLEIKIPDEITVGELASRLKVQAAEIIKRLMSDGVMASISDGIQQGGLSMVNVTITTTMGLLLTRSSSLSSSARTDAPQW